jgi:hypothetical protein
MIVATQMVSFLQNNIIPLKLFIEDLKELFIESSKIPVQQTKLIGLMYSQLPIIVEERERILHRFRSLKIR